jgi:hypothetical protein
MMAFTNNGKIVVGNYYNIPLDAIVHFQYRNPTKNEIEKFKNLANLDSSQLTHPIPHFKFIDSITLNDIRIMPELRGKIFWLAWVDTDLPIYFKNKDH